MSDELDLFHRASTGDADAAYELSKRDGYDVWISISALEHGNKDSKLKLLANYIDNKKNVEKNVSRIAYLAIDEKHIPSMIWLVKYFFHKSEWKKCMLVARAVPADHLNLVRVYNVIAHLHDPAIMKINLDTYDREIPKESRDCDHAVRVMYMYRNGLINTIEDCDYVLERLVLFKYTRTSKLLQRALRKALNVKMHIEEKEESQKKRSSSPSPLEGSPKKKVCKISE